MIIDTHTHFYDPFRPQGVPWPPADDSVLYRTVLPEQYKALVAPEGVTGTVVVEASAWPEDNQWILDLAAADPFIVGLVGHIDVDLPEFGAQLAHYAQNSLFLGIRCGGHRLAQVGERAFMHAMQHLAERSLVLDVLISGEHFGALIDLADRLPDLRIVINHLGAMPIDGAPVAPAWLERLQHAAERPNVHMKVSALMHNSTVQPAPHNVEHYRPALDSLWATFGPDRLLYGSDWPVCELTGDYAQCIDIVRTYFTEKGDAALANYFWKNAKAVYRWPER